VEHAGSKHLSAVFIWVANVNAEVTVFAVGVCGSSTVPSAVLGSAGTVNAKDAFFQGLIAVSSPHMADVAPGGGFVVVESSVQILLF